MNRQMIFEVEIRSNEKEHVISDKKTSFCFVKQLIQKHL